MNQFRKNFKPSILDRINTLYYSIRGVEIGNGSFIQWGSKIERFYKNVSIGSNVIIKPGSRICACNSKAKILIGNSTSIGHYTFIYSSKFIKIGSDCMIAPFNYFVDSNHQTTLGVKLMLQENDTEQIIIGDDCWIGQGCTIVMGGNMSNGSILGAKSFLNNSTVENSIYNGIPAKIISKRK